MSRTLEVSDETWDRIKDQLSEEEQTEVNSLEDFVGEKLYIRTITYNCVGEVVKKVSNLFELKNYLTQNAMSCYGIIVNTLKIHQKLKSSPNYDSINDMYACDLLWLLYEKIVLEKSEDHKILLNEALEDMNTGLCPVGRTVRLLNVLFMLRKDLTQSSTN